MSVPKDYKKDFPKNTKILFSKYYEKIEKDSGLEVTFLMNCLLGLIVTVSEKHKEELKNIKISCFDENLPESFELSSSDESSELIHRNKGYYNRLYASRFIRKLRNGISHQHITPLPEIDEDDSEQKWEKIKIEDFYIKKNKNGDVINEIKNFEIILTIEQLKHLAIAISELVPENKG